MPSTYDQYKDEVSSEKITLAVMQAAKRLIAFTVHSGSVYKLQNFTVPVISSVQEEGTDYEEVSSVGSVTAGTFYHDRDNQTLYLRTIDSENPNSVFLHLIQKFFFSTAPLTLPHDLSNGFEVYWEPSIKDTSNFGVEIDTINQASEAIDGSGSLTLYNDHDFWPGNFDKSIFENQTIQIYSYNRNLPASEAKLLYKGKIESKTYSDKVISFKLKDLLSELRDAVNLPNISELNLRHAANFANSKQRLILGKKKNHVPINVDSLVNNSYPITGTVSATISSATITGSGTQFLKELNPDDRLKIGPLEFTVGSVTNNTTAVLTSVYTGTSESGLSIEVIPSRSKRWINRVWNIAGHALRQPVTETISGSTTRRIKVASTKDFSVGDTLWFGSPYDEIQIIDRVLNETTFDITGSLVNQPVAGITITRPCIQKVKIDDVELTYGRDYTVDPSSATLTLDENAEKNIGSPLEIVDSATFTLSSRTVTGSGTYFKSFLKSGDVIRPKNTVDFYEILTVVSDEEITLREPYSDTTATAALQYKNLIFTPNTNTLHMEVLGKTVDGTPTGVLPRTSSQIILMLLKDAGLHDDIDESSFVDDFTPEEISLVVPEKVANKSSFTYKDVINSINKSTMSILFQNSDFKLAYDVIRPQVTPTMKRLDHSDILTYRVTSTIKNMVKKAIVEYDFKEYEEASKESVTESVSSSSDISRYILDTSRERTFESVLIKEEDAQRLANRWKFLLEYATNKITLQTKLQTADLQVNDIIHVDHPKMFERFGGASSKRIFLVESVKKSGIGIEITAVDLSNAFNRVALITDTQLDWSESGEETRLISGYISDQNGLIENDPDSYGVSLIW